MIKSIIRLEPTYCNRYRSGVREMNHKCDNSYWNWAWQVDEPLPIRAALWLGDNKRRRKLASLWKRTLYDITLEMWICQIVSIDVYINHY